MKKIVTIIFVIFIATISYAKSPSPYVPQVIEYYQQEQAIRHIQENSIPTIDIDGQKEGLKSIEEKQPSVKKEEQKPQVNQQPKPVITIKIENEEPPLIEEVKEVKEIQKPTEKEVVVNKEPQTTKEVLSTVPEKKETTSQEVSVVVKKATTKKENVIKKPLIKKELKPSVIIKPQQKVKEKLTKNYLPKTFFILLFFGLTCIVYGSTVLIRTKKEKIKSLLRERVTLKNLNLLNRKIIPKGPQLDDEEVDILVKKTLAKMKSVKKEKKVVKPRKKTASTSILLFIMFSVLITSSSFAASDSKSIFITTKIEKVVKLIVDTNTITFLITDETQMIPAQNDIKVIVKVRTERNDLVTLNIIAVSDLISGSDIIPVENVTWQAYGLGFQSGTLSKSPQIAGSWSGSVIKEMSFKFYLNNRSNYPKGEYKVNITYTITP